MQFPPHRIWHIANAWERFRFQVRLLHVFFFYFCSHIHIQKRSLPLFLRSFVPSFPTTFVSIGCTISGVCELGVFGRVGSKRVIRDVFFMQLVAQRQVTGKLGSTDPKEGEDKRAAQHHQGFVVVGVVVVVAVAIVGQFFLLQSERPRPKRDTIVDLTNDE